MIKYRIVYFVLSKLLALKRRLYLFIYKDFDPFPKYKNYSFSPSSYYLNKANNTALALNPKKSNQGNHMEWQKKARKRFSSLIKYNINLNGTIVEEAKLSINNMYKRKRYIIKFDNSYFMPLDIIKRKNKNGNKGIIICLQGTNSGAHLNIGQVRMPDDFRKIYNGGSLALQAADNGFTAVSFDRIGFGERRERNITLKGLNFSADLGYHSLVVGSTLLGDSVSEVGAVIKIIRTIISNKIPIWIVGYSAAGTIALASAAVNLNVSGIAVGGCLGFEKDTIIRRSVSGLNNIPNVLDWFEQDAQVSLIAPRPGVFIAGVKDHIWPYEYAKKVVDSSMKIYKLMNAEENLSLIKADGPHTFYPKLMWPAINRYFK